MGWANPMYQEWDQDRKKQAWKAYSKSLLLSMGGGALCGWIALGGEKIHWRHIIGLQFSPSSVIFLSVWEILYLLMGISATRIYLKADSEMRIYALKTYFWQLLFNWGWSIWIFNLQWYGFALFWLLTLVVQVIWMMAAFHELDLLSARLQIPYLIWLFFMAYLNFNAYMANS